MIRDYVRVWLSTVVFFPSGAKYGRGSVGEINEREVIYLEGDLMYMVLFLNS